MSELIVNKGILIYFGTFIKYARAARTVDKYWGIIEILFAILFSLLSFRSRAYPVSNSTLTSYARWWLLFRTVCTTFTIFVLLCMGKLNMNLYAETQWRVRHTVTVQYAIQMLFIRPIIKEAAEPTNIMTCRRIYDTEQAKRTGLTAAELSSFLKALWRRSVMLAEPFLAAIFFSSRV
jgi:hypothetical protein